MDNEQTTPRPRTHRREPREIPSAHDICHGRIMTPGISPAALAALACNGTAGNAVRGAPLRSAAAAPEEATVAIEIILGLAVLGLLIYRQLRARPINAGGLRLAAILAVIGVVETVEYLQKYHGGSATYAALGGSLVLAAVFGVLRAVTVRLWTQDGQVWSKGNWLTAALWIVALAAHLGYDALVAHGHGSSGNVGTATVVLYLAVSLGVQRLIAQLRASRMGLAPLGSPRSGQFS
jgi:hypothetical protein